MIKAASKASDADRKKLKLMIVAGEASGDVLGAGLIKAIKALRPDIDLTLVGVGGTHMAQLGLKSPFDYSELSVLGMIEGLKAYGRIKARVVETAALAKAENPDCVVLIDSWGFTLRVAQAIRKDTPKLPLIKYVGPQVWATRPGRAKTLAKAVDLLLALHPMDAPYFEREGLQTVVVGNPALNVDFTKAEPHELKQRLRIDEGDEVLCVLFGSRPSEIKRLWPDFRDTMNQLLENRPNLKIIVPIADTISSLLKDLLKGAHQNIKLIESEIDKLSAMKLSHLALACSGTVTTELALAGCPMVVAYRVEPLTYFIFKHISPLRFVTLFNIVADKAVAPEFIQPDCTPQNLVKALSERLDDNQLRNNQISQQYEALDRLGRGQTEPSNLAAKAVLEFLNL